MVGIKEEITIQLCEARDIEQAYEVQTHRDARKYSDSEMVEDLMDKLIDDSGMHREIVDVLLSKLSGCDNCSGYPTKHFVFNFERAWDKEIVKEVMWLEKKMANHYRTVLDLISANDCSSFLSEEELGKIKAGLDHLAKEEVKHFMMAEEVYNKLDQ